jgi:hypothetical protein
MEILNAVMFVVLGIVSIVLFTLAWRKIYKCPDHLWEELRRTPHNKSYDVIQRILK